MRELLRHENEAGYRYCVLCGQWKPQGEFARSPLCHDRRHPLCLLHVDQGEANFRAAHALGKLTRAGVSAGTRLTGHG